MVLSPRLGDQQRRRNRHRHYRLRRSDRRGVGRAHHQGEAAVDDGDLRGPPGVAAAVAKFRGQQNAFGKPGISPSWTHGDKDGVGTAYAASSRVWFTLWNGILTEVYYPYVDRPQTRDLQFLVTDGKSF